MIARNLVNGDIKLGNEIEDIQTGLHLILFTLGKNNYPKKSHKHI